MSDLPANDQTHFYLAALHFYGYSVAIPSPTASPDGMYLVSAHRLRGAPLKAARRRLDDAVAAVAHQLGDHLLLQYAAVAGIRKQAQARKAGV